MRAGLMRNFSKRAAPALHSRSGITTAVAAVAIVVVLIVAGAAGYLAGASGARTSVSTLTQSLTQTAGGGSTVTVTVATAATTSVNVITTATTSVNVITTATTSVNVTTTGGQNLDPANVLACANQEGKITVYGLVDTPAWNQFITTAWEATYPNVKMSYLGLASGDLLTKALAEHKAGVVQSDVLETFVNAIVALNQSGAITQWQNPEEAVANYSASALDPSNAFHPFNDYITTPAYNTKVISQSQLPKSWNDLLTNSSFSGKFAYSKPAVLGTGAGIMFGLSLYENLSYSQWTAFMKQAAGNSPVLTVDDGGSMTDVVTGQVPIGIGGTNDIQAAEAANGTLYAPLWLNPVFVSRVPIAISQGAPDN
jgi:Bacterial extracellular solute-binding protein